MFRSIVSRSLLAVACATAVAIPGFSAQDQKPNSSQDKNFDVRSSVGDLHIGSDADARKTGLSLYPGARLKPDDQKQNKVNLGLLTEAFGFKLVVVNYDSDDAPAKVIDFYRDKLKKYGKVLECHSRKHGGDVDVNNVDVNNDDKDSQKSKELKCEGDNTGPVTELKVGTEDNQHVVAIEPTDGHGGGNLPLVFEHTPGEQKEILYVH